MKDAHDYLPSDEETYARLASLPPAEYDRCRDKEAAVLEIRVKTLDDEVERLRAANRTAAQGSTDLQPWDESVDGAALLQELANTYNRFCWLSPYVAAVLAAFTLLTYCFRAFRYAPIVALWSPEPECGKSRVLDVADATAKNPLRTANVSAAVLYHSIDEGDTTLLVDEYDSQHEDQRAAIANILKSGFESNGKAHRMMERNGTQVCAEFSTFGPKMIAMIGLDVLDKATRTRSIGVRMQRKPRETRLAKFRRFDGTVLRRKCMRWAQHNMAALEKAEALDLNECATDRQEDIWEPLVIIGRVAGGEWEVLMREAARELSGAASKSAAETLPHQILAGVREFFIHDNRTEVPSQAILAYLEELIEGAQDKARKLTYSSLARALRGYGIESTNIRTGPAKVVKGYRRKDFKSAFAAYLDAPATEKAPDSRYTATNPINIDPNEGLAAATQPFCSGSENAVPTNNDAPCSGVAAKSALPQDQTTFHLDADII